MTYGLIARAERFAHAFQRATGYTSFFLARCGLLLSGFGLATTVMNYYGQIFTLKSDTFDVVIACVFSLLFIVPYYELLKRADSVIDSALPAWIGIMRGEYHVPRLLIFFIGVSSIGIALTLVYKEPLPVIYLLHHCGAFGLASFHYFLQVNPLPPCRGSVFDQISAFFTPRVSVKVIE